MDKKFDMLTGTNSTNLTTSPNFSPASPPAIMSSYDQQPLPLKDPSRCGESSMSHLPRVPPATCCQAKQDFHNHLPLPMDSLTGVDESCHLPVESFLPRALAEILTTVGHHTGEYMLPRQQKAMQRFQELQSQLHLYQARIKGVDFGTIMQGYLEIFDNFYFFGTLARTGRVKFVLKSNEIKKGFFGETNWDPGFAMITLWQHGSENDLKRPYHAMIISKYAHTLLHEMVHAFLGMFSCGPCYYTWEGCGKKDHGKIWLDVMASLTQASFGNGFFNKKIRWRADLRHALATELIANKLPIPDKTTLKSWCMTRSEIEDDIELLIRGEENKAVTVAQKKASGLLSLYELGSVVVKGEKEAPVKAKTTPNKRKRVPDDQVDDDVDSSSNSEKPLDTLTTNLKNVKIKRRSTTPKKRLKTLSQRGSSQTKKGSGDTRGPAFDRP